MDNRSNIYNLPYTTEQILKEIQPEKACENLGLLLDKYIPINVFERPSRENPQAGKAPWLMSIFKPESGKETQNNHIDAVFARNAYNRWHTMTQTMGAEPFDLTIDWRMVIGLGGETVLETDITLHHLYGIPFIPGSALKGLTRAYITGEIEGYKSDKIEKDNEEVKLIFGSQERAGRVIFFDAMPNGVVKFVLDIINPHYADYYGGTKPPTNDQSPIPVTFLTVADTTFTFALAPRNSNDPEHKADVEKVKGWLQEALQKYGVGGKTSAGYGYFKKEMSSSEPPQPKKAQEPVTQAQAHPGPQNICDLGFPSSEKVRTSQDQSSLQQMTYGA
jgi:CRISPR-associated protein Cmr6